MTDLDKKRNWFQRLFAVRGMGQVITVFFGLIALCAVFYLINPNFLSERNATNLLRQIAPYLIIGIGQGYVLITGNIDLSIGSVVGMSTMISATLMTHGMDPWLAMLVTIIPCLMTGLLNGFLVSVCKLPPFIGTLGTMTIARGVAQLVNGNMNTDAIGRTAEGWRNLFYYGRTLGIYNTFWIALVIWLIFNFLLSRTRTGRHVYAIGSNAEASKLSGVSVSATTIKAYLVSAFCAGVVGLITCAQAGMGAMDAGTGYELYAVAASVIGGISTLGGQGILLGTVMGASVWGVMYNGLSLVGAPVAWRNIVVGIIVVLSVLIDVLVRSGTFNKARIRALFCKKI
ncbi:MAG: ABC transporter permease [Clostridia bacterium]|nr:ABC transporter permease [Clostridia bacterium]